MPRGKLNKAEEIRGTFSRLGKDARPRDVIAVLAKQKIRVSSARVSAIKAKLNNGARRSKQRTDIVSLNDLLAAKKFVDTVGSIATARSALDALERILG